MPSALSEYELLNIDGWDESPLHFNCLYTSLHNLYKHGVAYHYPYMSQLVCTRDGYYTLSSSAMCIHFRIPTSGHRSIDGYPRDREVDPELLVDQVVQDAFIQACLSDGAWHRIYPSGSSNSQCCRTSGRRGATKTLPRCLEQGHTMRIGKWNEMNGWLASFDI